MSKIKTLPNHAGRREFLKRASAFSVGGVAAPLMLNLAAIGEAAAQTADDYKALVCVFLYGANDHNNTVIPYDAASYTPYSTIRQTLARVRDTQTTAQLTSSVALDGGRGFALASELAGMKTIWDAGHLALTLNVGPLIQPTSKAQYSARNVPLPPKLFSHNDQQSIWQSLESEGSTAGWGGRMGDLLASGNGSSVFTSISVTGNAVYSAGATVNQYQISPTGSVALRAKTAAVYGSSQVAATLQQLVQQSGTNLLEAEYAKIVQRAIVADGQLSSVLSGIAPPSGFTPGESLSAQLAMVVRLLQAHQTLGAKRQVFFVSLGGFDLHDFLTELHPGLLMQVNNAMKSFYDALGTIGLRDKVTTFTASDFGRTLTSNGDGSDHGWGSHHFVMGAAVRGGRYYGRSSTVGGTETIVPPIIANNGPDDVGSGRLLPSVSVDQFGATMASWFGVSESDLNTVFPNLRNFTTKNLGFMV